MTSRLAIVRSRLSRLRRARAALRAVAAWSALGISILLALAAVFLLDVVFDLAAGQRVVALLLAAAAVGWAWWRFTRPYLGPRESEIELALFVEKQHRIESDLVAALQFESPAATRWGSAELSDAVVSRMANAAPAINVFEGLPQKVAAQRAASLAVCVLLALTLTAVAPGHVAAFASRICLGKARYPTRTRIEQIVVNRTLILKADEHDPAPAECQAPQGRPLIFTVKCSGRLPRGGSVALAATDLSHRNTRLELRPLSLEQRQQRLQHALAKLNAAITNAETTRSVVWRSETHALLLSDAPDAAEQLLAEKSPTELQTAADTLQRAIDRLPDEYQRTAVLAGELNRLNEDMTFRVAAGDARTAPAHIEMIPLPIVELTATPLPPKYAAKEAKSDATGRQLAVIEGSTVELTVRSVNRKPLQTVWLNLQRPGEQQRVELNPVDTDLLVWSPPATGTPLADIRRDLKFEIEVIDQDGLSLEMPLRGVIRIRPDQHPTSIAEVIHKVVLPGAAPVVSYRATDDFGISSLALVVDVERGGANRLGPTTTEDSSISPAVAAPSEQHRFDIVSNGPHLGDRLPVSGNYPLPLEALKLAKGDRIKLTLEATDYRGDNDQGQPIGHSACGDSLVLEISDESGVLAAISQPDQKSAEQLTEIIKRQLGIGEEAK